MGGGRPDCWRGGWAEIHLSDGVSERGGPERAAAPRPALVGDDVTVSGGRHGEEDFCTIPRRRRIVFCFILVCIVCLLFCRVCYDSGGD